MFLVLGCVYVALGALLFVSGSVAAGGVALVGVGLGLAGYRSLGALWAVPRLNLAYQRVERGELAAAEALLDAADTRLRLPSLRRASLLQRANIAQKRGDMARAEAHLDAALALRGGLFSPLPPDAHQASCHGLRAFVRASRGELDGALADAEVTRAHPHAIPGSLAFALVAEGLVRQKRGEKAALRAFLGEHRRALFELTTPRLRSIARALARFARTESASVYRRVAEPPRGDVAVEPPLEVWMDGVLPELAPFAPRLPARVENAAPAVSAASPGVRAAPALATSLRLHQRPEVRVAAAMTLLVGVIALGWVRATDPDTHDAAPDTGGFILTTPALYLGVFLAALGYVFWRRRRAKAQLAAIQRAARALLTAPDAALRALRGFAEGPLHPVLRAQALLVLAGEQLRATDFEGALRDLERGLALASAYRTMTHDLLLPGLLGTRATALAFAGRGAEAQGELARLERDFPTYALLPGARYRVSLGVAVGERALAGAAAVALARPADLTLSGGEELLSGLVAGLHAPHTIGGQELERLREDLRDDTTARRFVQHVAPDWLRAFEEPEDDARRERAAETEALAAEEAGGAANRRGRA